MKGVSLRRSGITILEGVDWTVRPGEHWALLGANGSGKTSLLEMAAGYAWPTRGSVSVLGHRWGSVDLRKLRRAIGWVSPALSRRIEPGAGVAEVVVSARYGAHDLLFHVERPEDRDRATELLRVMGIEHLKDRKFGILSDGERQRALIARALAQDPSLLVLDEPAAGLDLAAREDLLQAVQVLTEVPEGPAVLLVTHHPEEVMPGFTHALLLAGGRPVAGGPVDEVMTESLLGRTFGLSVEVQMRANRRWVFPAEEAVSG